jgi:PAS domain S-box-containing protein
MSTEFELAAMAVMVALGLLAIAGLLLLYSRQRSYAEELRQSEARLRTIAEHIGEGLALYDQDDRLLFFNEPYRRMQETAEGSLRPGMLFESLAMDRARVLKAMGEINDVNAFVADRVARHRNPDGRVIERRRPDGGYHLIREGRTADGQIVVSFVDITELKRREAALQESEGRLRAIIAAEPECVAIVAPEGDLLDMNPAGLRMLEASSLEEMRRFPFLNQVAPHYRRAFVRLQHGVLEGQSGVLEFEAIGIHGKHCWLEIHAAPLHDVSGRISALLGIARDVTERRLVREALAAERNLLRTVIDNLPDRIRAKDRDLRFMLANAAWMQARAPERSDVLGLRNSDLLPPDIAARVEAEDRAVLESGQPSPLREVMIGSAGNPRWYVTAKMPLRDSAGNVTGLVAISRDVTDFKQRSLEVEKLNTELEARVAERTAQLTVANEELEAFASSVSHDLRAPLRHIDGMSAALLEDFGADLDEAGRDYVARIRGASQRMAALIEDLLRLSRVTRTALKIVDADLSGMAVAIADELRREHDGREVAFTAAPGLRVRGDTGLLRAALMNLLQNAWKFTGRQPQARVEFGAELRDGSMVYFVRDNGAGFDMAHADRLFGTFQRLHTEREFPGTGIGLATVRRIMRRHGGEVWAESAPDVGSTFFFTLASRLAAPAYAAATPEVMLQAAEPAAPPATAWSAVVLLVDDDPDVLTLSIRALRPAGYEILTAGNGETAMAILRSRAVGVIVSDFSMPGMNGAQLLAQAAALQPATLRIIVSGQTMNRAMQAGLRSGEIHHYFEKQHSYEPVQACIRDWLDAQPGK